MVASLTFGYWTTMLGKEYEDLWQKTLKDIARREDGKGLRRKDFSTPLGRSACFAIASPIMSQSSTGICPSTIAPS